MDQDELIEKHMKLAERTARNWRRKIGGDLDPLLSAAYLGLLHASRKFDPSRGYSFLAYANRAINNSIIDEARNLQALEANSFKTLALDESSVGGVALQDVLCCATDQPDLHGVPMGRVRRAIAALPRVRRLVIEMHYLDGISMDDIAEVLGVTRQGVNFNKLRGLEDLRAILTAETA